MCYNLFYAELHTLSRDVMLYAVAKVAGCIESSAGTMLSFNCSRSLGIWCYTMTFNIAHNQISGGDRNGLLGAGKNQTAAIEKRIT